MIDVTADSRKRNVMINCCSGEITFRNFVSFFSNIGVTILSRYASLCVDSLGYLEMKIEKLLQMFYFYNYCQTTTSSF